MRRILLVLGLALVMAAMLVATAAPAMALNTFQLPVFKPGTEEVIIGVEEKGSGPPAASGGPAFGSIVFHCEGGGTTVVHADRETGLPGDNETGGEDCRPAGF